jgi:hypothetical protein
LPIPDQPFAMLSLGSSGNPAGRPKGSYDKRAELRELLKPHADDSVEKAVGPCAGRRYSGIKPCLDRLMPPLQSRAH